MKKFIIAFGVMLAIAAMLASCAKQNPSEPAAQNTPADTATITDTPTITQTPTRTDTPTITHTQTDTATATQTYTETSTATATSTPTQTQTPTITPITIDNFSDGNLTALYGAGGVNTWSYNTDSLGGGNSRIDRFEVSADNHCAEYALSVSGVVKTDLGSGAAYGYVDVSVTAFASGATPADISGYDFISFYSGCSIDWASIKLVNVMLLSGSGDNVSYAYTATGGCNYYNLPFSAFTVNSGTLEGAKAGLVKMIFRIYVSDAPGNQFGFTYTLDSVEFRK
jgi:hypothetical protein